MFLSRAKKSSTTIRIVSYNVLSPSLATPSSYPTLTPDPHLDPTKRLEVVLQKLEQEISHPRVIVCLQEISYDWAGSLHTFFANRGYHMVTGLYGRKFNGYMGVAMAWPTSSFETLDVDISRLSDTREAGWPREDLEDRREAGKQDKAFAIKQCFSLFSWLLPSNHKKNATTATTNERPPIDPWEYSERRFNVLLTATLKEKETGNMFCIGNYHMPCAFYAPPVMTIHCDLAARRVQQLAQEQAQKQAQVTNGNDKIVEGKDPSTSSSKQTRSLPYIVAGDWNIKPEDAAYQLLTTGKLSQDDPAYPPPALSKYNNNNNPSKILMTWKPSIVEPLRSAYATCHAGQEPDFTNYAAPRSTFEEDNGFINTLDYIFVSPQWKVVSTPELPSRDGVKGPFPNLTVREPSDHILISAKLELDSRQYKI